MKMCRFWKLSGKMVIKHLKKGRTQWLSVLMGHRGGDILGNARTKNGGQWAKMGGNGGEMGKNRAEVGDTLWGGGGGARRVCMQSMGPVSQCCRFFSMDHVHPYKGVCYIPLKLFRDPQRVGYQLVRILPRVLSLAI